LIQFPDLHKILLKSGGQPLAAFQNSFVEIQGMCQPVGKGGLLFAIFKRFLQIQKQLVLSG
jgi:hypothetical protein